MNNCKDSDKHTDVRFDIYVYIDASTFTQGKRHDIIFDHNRIDVNIDNGAIQVINHSVHEDSGRPIDGRCLFPTHLFALSFARLSSYSPNDEKLDSSVLVCAQRPAPPLFSMGKSYLDSIAAAVVRMGGGGTVTSTTDGSKPIRKFRSGTRRV